VKYNRPGKPDFCPLVLRTKRWIGFAALDLPERARAIVAAALCDILARTVAFLLLED
jgi:hypothetical protein